MITQEELQEMLSYDESTGIFVWLRSGNGSIVPGTKAGGISNGYVVIRVNKKHYKAHRLAFVYVTGNCPPNIDHINGNRADNRFENLRAATLSQNCMNRGKPVSNSSGYKGVRNSRNRWRATIGSGGKRYYLGYFDTPEEAYEAYCEAAKKLHGDFFHS